ALAPKFCGRDRFLTSQPRKSRETREFRCDCPAARCRCGRRERSRFGTVPSREFSATRHGRARHLPAAICRYRERHRARELALGSTAQTLAYGFHALPLAMLGLFSYGGGVPALVLGYFFLRRAYGELERGLWVFGGLIAVMLIGVPLEYLGYKFGAPWLGTIRM